MIPPNCQADQVVADVKVESLVCANGKADRKVTITRTCGHTYYWSRPLNIPTPAVGDPAMGCIGPQLGSFTETFPKDLQPTLFDTRKGLVKKRKARKGEA